MAKCLQQLAAAPRGLDAVGFFQAESQVGEAKSGQPRVADLSRGCGRVIFRRKHVFVCGWLKTRGALDLLERWVEQQRL